MKSIPISTFMSKSVVVANKNHTFSQVLEFFAKFPVHHIPVVEGDTVVGIISAKDVIKHLYIHLERHGFQVDREMLNVEKPLESIMTANPVTLTPDDTLQRAASIFERSKFNSIPIVKEGKVQGIITTKDIARQILLLSKPF